MAFVMVKGTLTRALFLARTFNEELRRAVSTFQGREHASTSEVAETSWHRLHAETSLFPEQLPDHSDAHLVELRGRMPALLLTEWLFTRLKTLAQDFKRLERIESFSRARIEHFEKDMERIEGELADLYDRLDEAQRVLDDQKRAEQERADRERAEQERAEQERTEQDCEGEDSEEQDRAGGGHAEKSTEDEEPCYSVLRTHSLEQEIEQLERLRQARIESRHRCGEEMWRNRRETVHAQYELCSFLGRILEEGGFLPTEAEQWRQDRRFLSTNGLQDLHEWATKMGYYPFAGDDQFRDRAGRGGGLATQQDSGRDDTARTDAARRKADALKNAKEVFGMCHWNRRVARDDFERRAEHAQIRQQAAVEKFLLQPDGDFATW